MKSQRQAKILELIGQKDIETQEQLLMALEESGFRSSILVACPRADGILIKGLRFEVDHAI